LQQIRELAKKSKGNVIHLDDATYGYYATSKPRPYTLMVFLTATHPKFKCGVCREIDSEFSVLADSYAQGTKGEHDIFFLRLDYEQSQKVFQSYQVTSVPLLFHVGPQVGMEKPGTEYKITARDKYQVPTHPDAESLANFLNDRAGVSIKIERSKIVSYIILLVVFAILAALVQPVINALPTIMKLVQWKPLWIAVSLGVYTCAISGLIYDIIRSPQM
jgi:oligosaccharyltransferase complex subunit gamma